jgi:hypothetical protein
MKYFSLLFSLSLIAFSSQAKALDGVEYRAEYRYECEALDSDLVSLVTVDANGKYLVYEDSGNNCNGRRNFVAHSSYPLFETDCEWKGGFVDFLLAPQMFDGANNGKMVGLTTDSETLDRRYLCKRIQ